MIYLKKEETREGDRLMRSENLFYRAPNIIIILLVARTLCSLSRTRNGDYNYVLLLFPLSSLFVLAPICLPALPRNDIAFHKSARFVGERILGIRMTNRASVYKRVRLIVQCVPRKYLLYKLS